MLEMLMETFGILVFLLGIALASSGWRLREKMRAVQKDSCTLKKDTGH